MTFLSDEWLASAVATAEDRAVAGSFTGAVEVEVGGGPSGKVRVRWVFEEGRLVTADAEKGAEPDVSLTLKHEDARGLVAGTRDLNALFISGQMKVAGATGPLLDLISASRSDEFIDYRNRLEQATTG